MAFSSPVLGAGDFYGLQHSIDLSAQTWGWVLLGGEEEDSDKKFEGEATGEAEQRYSGTWV